jgi:biopolymer transport protein ExbB
MARHRMSSHAVFSMLAVCVFALVQAGPALAGTNIEGIMATPDSLAFASGVQDSVKETPPVVDTSQPGLMGLFEDSPLGKTAFGDVFIRGGGFMWWLLLSAVVCLALIVERILTLSRASVNSRKLVGSVLTTLRNEGVEAASEQCLKVRGPTAAVLHAGLQKADHGRDAVEKAVTTAGTLEMAFLERGLIWIASVSTIAPLIGFLGTAFGMAKAFKAIAAGSAINAQVVTYGIQDAFITTATGLIIAVPAAIAFNWLVQRIDHFVVEMREASTELVDELGRRQRA